METVSITSTAFIKIASLLWKRKVMENLGFLDSSLKRNQEKIFALVYKKPRHTDLHYSSHHRTSYKESVASSLLKRAYSIITNKDNLPKGNARIKQVLKENENQQSIIRKILRELPAIRTCLDHNNQRKPQISKRRYQNEYEFTVR